MLFLLSLYVLLIVCNCGTCNINSTTSLVSQCISGELCCIDETCSDQNGVCIENCPMFYGSDCNTCGCSVDIHKEPWFIYVIIIGSALIFLLCILCVIFCLCKKKDENKMPTNTDEMTPNY
mmetsp:Transcript_93278/g.114254  ORF Transcript_93278/g.114254 Transcript_93278/m.114254 type:complete len:121 (+) Transcript_93278:44-406(+)